jgi:hypothetical protein
VLRFDQTLLASLTELGLRNVAILVSVGLIEIRDVATGLISGEHVTSASCVFPYATAFCLSEHGGMP